MLKKRQCYILQLLRSNFVSFRFVYLWNSIIKRGSISSENACFQENVGQALENNTIQISFGITNNKPKCLLDQLT